MREPVFGVDVKGSPQAVRDALVDWERQGTRFAAGVAKAPAGAAGSP